MRRHSGPPAGRPSHGARPAARGRLERSPARRPAAARLPGAAQCQHGGPCRRPRPRGLRLPGGSGATAGVLRWQTGPRRGRPSGRRWPPMSHGPRRPRLPLRPAVRPPSQRRPRAGADAPACRPERPSRGPEPRGRLRRLRGSRQRFAGYQLHARRARRAPQPRAGLSTRWRRPRRLRPGHPVRHERPARLPGCVRLRVRPAARVVIQVWRRWRLPADSPHPPRPAGPLAAAVAPWPHHRAGPILRLP